VDIVRDGVGVQRQGELNQGSGRGSSLRGEEGRFEGKVRYSGEWLFGRCGDGESGGYCGGQITAGSLRKRVTLLGVVEKGCCGKGNEILDLIVLFTLQCCGINKLQDRMK
jgi:hypothetical protein